MEEPSILATACLFKLEKKNLPSGIGHPQLSGWERQEQNPMKDKLDNIYVKDI